MDRLILSLEGWINSVAVLEARLGRLKDDEVRRVGAIFAHVTPRVIEELISDSDACSLIDRRLQKKKLYLVSRLGDPGINKFFAFSIAGLKAADEEIDSLRNDSLLSIVRKHWSSAVIETEGHHFLAPSGYHVQRFLRLASCIKSWQDTECLSFWLLDDIQWADAIVIDTWGISPLVLWAIAELRKSKFFLRSIEPYDETTRDRVRSILQEIKNQKDTENILFVTSVSSTGYMQTTINEVLEEQNLRKNSRTISLFAFNDASKVEKIYCVIPEDQKLQSPDACELCVSSQYVLETIHPEDYAVKYLKEKKELIGRKDYEASRDITRRHAGFERAFTVHRNDPNDRQHHAFYIDFGKLIEIPSFRERYLQLLRPKIIAVDLVVVPRHSRGELIARLASECGAAKIIRHDNLRKDENMSVEYIGWIADAKRLLILDDIALTGSRLQNYVQALREQADLFGGFESVDYFIGLARPSSLENWKQLSNGLTTAHTWKSSLSVVETFVLPHWDQDKCPWCLEYQVLTQIAYREALPEKWLEKRIAQLSAQDIGVNESCLCLGQDMEEPKAGSSSELVDKGGSALEVMFILGSAIQHVRTTRNLGDKYPRWIVLNPWNIIGRYTECMFQAAFFKCTSQVDWSLNDKRLLTSKMIEGALAEHGRFLSIELIIQIKRGLLTTVGNEEKIRQLIQMTWGKHAKAVLKEIGLDKDFSRREKSSYVKVFYTYLTKIPLIKRILDLRYYFSH